VIGHPGKMPYPTARSFFRLITKGNELYKKTGRDVLTAKSFLWTAVLVDQTGRFTRDRGCKGKILHTEIKNEKMVFI